MEGVITKRYGDNTVFNSFSFNLPECEVTWLKGTSGKGKTTFLRLITGLESLDAGDLSEFRNKSFSYAFQEPRLIEQYSAKANLALVTKDEERVNRLLAYLELPLDGKLVKNFSQGMKTRLSILRALLKDSDILILDEPFNGLDLAMREKVGNLINQERNNRTTLIVTHVDSDMKTVCYKNTINL